MHYREIKHGVYNTIFKSIVTYGSEITKSHTDGILEKSGRKGSEMKGLGK